jgi:hypothetical protein
VVGAVYSEAWVLYKRFWRHFLPIAFLLYAVIGVATVLLTLALGAIGFVVAVLLTIVGLLWLQGALVLAVQDVRDGRADLTIGETIRRVGPYAGTLTVAGLTLLVGAAAVVIAVGFIFPFLLIVVFLVFVYALVRWVFLVPAIVLEGRDAFGAFGRSRDLTSGQFWTVLGVVLLALVVEFVGGIVVATLFLWLPDSARGGVQSLVGNTLITPFVAAAWTLLYFRLRGEAEEPEPGPAPAL